MRAIHASIHNVLGIDAVNLDFGTVNYFEGPNGTGKTSELEALQSIFTGTSLKMLKNINAGDEHAEIVVYFNSDSGEIIARRTEKGVIVERQIGDTAAMEKISRPAEFLRSLVHGGMANPVKFMQCNDKERVQMLLEALPVEMNNDEFWEAIGLKEEDFPPVPDGVHPLLAIARHREAIFKRRTGVNVDAKKKAASCDQIRRTVPKAIPTVDGLEQAQEELSGLKVRHATGTQKIESVADSDEKSIRAELAEAERLAEADMKAFREQVYKEAEQRIAAKKAELDEQFHDRRDKAQKKICEIHLSKKAELDDINQMLPEIEALSGRVGELKEQIRNAADIKTRHELADGFEGEAIALQVDSDKLTAALAALDAFKANLVDELPIRGLEITDGDVTVDGVPWAQVNTAKKIEIAVRVILLRYKDAPFKPVFVDGAEAFDSQTLAIFEQEIKNHGAQAFVARVTDTAQVRKVG